MSVKSDARDAARAVESSPVLRGLARGGYAANGVVHLLIGTLALVVAAGGDEQTDQTGAFRAVAGAPLGFAGLWVLAVALGALGLWHLVAGALLRRSRGADAKERARVWGLRLSEWGQGVVFLALGVLSASVALGARPNAEQSATEASRGILSLPGGPLLLGAIGVGVGIGGVAFVWMGVRVSFEKKLALPTGALGATVRGLGIAGFVAKGIALAIVGVLLTVAAVRVDPTAAGGLDGAIAALIALPAGPWLAGSVGVGLIAYGVFCMFRARYATL